MATPPHCYYAFDVLTAHLTSRAPHPLAKLEAHYNALHPSSGTSTNGTNSSDSTPNSYTTAAPLEKSPLFITWKIHKPSSAHPVLRGCIGTFSPHPIEEGIAEYTLTSALHDTRFNPITTSELPRLEVSVTLLTDFEAVASPLDWEVGVHGIQLDFVYRGRRLGATYLPDVAVEQGWGREETVVSCMRKAGWTGRREEWRAVELRCTRYRGEKKTVGWEGYTEFIEGFEEGVDG